MSHRIRVSGIEGQVPGEAVTRMNQLIRQNTEMDTEISSRIGMSLKDYQALIQDEYWVSGQDAVDENMADKVVLGRCGPDMNGQYQSSVMTLFGPMSVTWSDCPLISAPLGVDAGQLIRGITNPEQKAALIKFLDTLFLNKKEFTRKYILTKEYTKILAE